MSDRYSSLIHTPVGQMLAKNLGLPNPVDLQRYSEGDPVTPGTVLVGGNGRLREPLTGALGDLGVTFVDAPTEGARFKGLVYDASGLTSSDQLVELQQFFSPVMRSLETCPRV